MGYHLDPDSLFPALSDVYRFKFAALTTPQHGLTRDAELKGCLSHGHEAVACILTEAGDEVIVQANAPRRAGCQLLTGDDTLVDPAMQSRRRDAEYHGGLLDRDQFSVGGGGPCS